MLRCIRIVGAGCVKLYSAETRGESSAELRGITSLAMARDTSRTVCKVLLRRGDQSSSKLSRCSSMSALTSLRFESAMSARARW